MLNFIKYKIKNKKLLNACLCIGVILLSGFLCIYPMFREGSLNKLLQTLFVEMAVDKSEFPAAITRNGEVNTVDISSIQDIFDEMDEYETVWKKYIDCPSVINQRVIIAKDDYAETSFGSKTLRITYGTVPNLEKYSKVLYGTSAEDVKNSDNQMVTEAVLQGAIPCVISQKTMDQYGLSVGEVLEFQVGSLQGNGKLRMVVSGIIEEKENDDYFWHNRLGEFSDVLLIAEEEYDKLISSNRMEISYYYDALLFDYTKINSQNAKEINSYLKQFSQLDSQLNNNFGDILDEYGHQEKSISIILITFVLPIVALLLLFLYMISGRILEMETTEIAMLKSRGVSRGKVIKLYICQTSVISTVGCLLGIPVGICMCKLAAGTNAFLSFSFKDVSIYKITWTMLIFVLIAFVLSVLFMSLPVISLSKLTITDRKNLRVDISGKALWEKCFFDLILLLVSGYLLFNYNKQKDYMAIQIIEGKGIDPILFLDSSLFILACGLLFLRLMGYLIRLINYIGRKWWKPETYVTFLQIIRNRKRQGFITVFLVMTLAMGIFNASLARTVNENMEQRTVYNVGTDLRLQEKWNLITIKLDTGEYLWNYREPDFSRFNLLNDYGISQKTKVIIDNKTDITIDKKVEKGNTLMAIHTKEFGEIATLNSNLNEEHWYYYLNELAKNPKGVLISKNLADKYDVKVGDAIQYERYSPIDSEKTYVDVRSYVCGIVEAFPGFESIEYIRNEQGELVTKDNYLIVANYATVVNNCYLTPYQVWMKADGNYDIKEIEKALEDNNIKITSIIGQNNEIQKERNSAMIQITNGMFSVGFIISLLICAVGFLIYWILTIKEREMLYGIYRAMGMSMGEITKMLIIEQIFSSIFAAISGAAVGFISTVLFAKLISVVYLPRKHNLPIEIFFKAEDIVKIAIIICITFGVCFAVMSRTVRKMDITKALKMGED